MDGPRYLQHRVGWVSVKDGDCHGIQSELESIKKLSNIIIFLMPSDERGWQSISFNVNEKVAKVRFFDAWWDKPSWRQRSQNSQFARSTKLHGPIFSLTRAVCRRRKCFDVNRDAVTHSITASCAHSMLWLAWERAWVCYVGKNCAFVLRGSDVHLLIFEIWPRTWRVSRCMSWRSMRHSTSATGNNSQK